MYQMPKEFTTGVAVAVVSVIGLTGKMTIAVARHSDGRLAYI